MSLKTTIKLKFYFNEDRSDELCHELEMLDGKLRMCWETTHFFDDINAASRKISDIYDDPKYDDDDIDNIHSEIEILQHNDNGTNTRVIYQLTEIFEDNFCDMCLHYNMTDSSWNLECYNEIMFSCYSMIPAILELLSNIEKESYNGDCFNYAVW